MSTTVTIKTYAELEQWRDAFLKPDGLNLLFLIGNPGAGKSASFRDSLDEKVHHNLNAARLTTFQLYKRLYKVRNKAIILDDVDDALKRSDMARLLMALCETDNKARTVAWLGTESLLKVRNGQKVIRVPQEFETTSRVCLVCNDWTILTSKFGALLDRGIVVFFDPTSDEIHRFVGQWFQDKEVYDFVGNRLTDILQHSIRYYIHAREQKRLGLDWQTVLLESWSNQDCKGSASERLVRTLIADTSFQNDTERSKAFEAHGGGCRRTWYYIKKRLRL